MKTARLTALCLIFLFARIPQAVAGNKALITVEGSITDSAGNPVNGTGGTVVAQIVAPTGCVLWNETITGVNFVNGGFVLSLGGGSNAAAGSVVWNQVFQNGVSLGGGSLTGCTSGNSYTGLLNDDRTLYLTLSGAGLSTAQAVPAIALKANAQNAMLAGYPFLGVPNSGQSITFDGTEWMPYTPASSGTIAANQGGTGQTSYSVGDLLYASGATALSALHAGSAGQVLTSNGGSSAPSWQAAGGGVSSVAAASTAGNPISVSGTVAAPTIDIGTVPVSRGGTGLTSFTANTLLVASSASALSSGPGYSTSNTASALVQRDTSGNFAANNITASGTIYPAGSGSNTVTLGGPSTAVSASFSLKLPASVLAGGYLTTDGAGQLSFAAISSVAASGATTNAIPIWTNTTTLGSSPLTVSSGAVISSGNVSIGTGAAPTAVLQLKAGTATAGTAPLKFTPGAILSSTESGAMEFDGTYLYLTLANGIRKFVLGGWAGFGTPSTNGGNLGGFTGAAAHCSTNAHMCTQDEMMRYAQLSPTVGGLPASGVAAWFGGFFVNNTGTAETCNGWNDNTGGYSGTSWTFGSAGGAPSLSSCNSNLNVACCY